LLYLTSFSLTILNSYILTLGDTHQVPSLNNLETQKLNEFI
jgi:hypothetical protein